MDQLVNKLSRAELITHLVEIDQDAVGEKDAAACVLDVLDTQVFRIAPYLYGVDLSALEGASDIDRVDAVSEALTARLGEGVVGMTTLILDPPAESEPDGEQDEDVLLLIRAVATAAEKAAGENASNLRAVLSAEFAVRAAELTARGLADLAVPASSADGGELSEAMEATTQALGALEARLGQLEARVGEVLTTSEVNLRDWVLSELVAPLREAEAQIGARLDALKDGQFPAEWLLSQLSERIGDLDQHLTESERETHAAALDWARRLDDRISAVSDQLIPPEWFLGRILSRIGELDEQLSGNDEQVKAAATEWAERLEARLAGVAEQMMPPEWFMGRILERIDKLEEDLSAKVTSTPAPEESRDSDVIANLASEQALIKRSVASLKGQVTQLSKKQSQHADSMGKSLELIKTALAELIAQNATLLK